MAAPLPLVILTQFLAVAAFYPATRWVGARRRVAFLILMAVIFCAPLLIPGDRRVARLAATLAAAWTASKLYDLHGNAGGRQPVSLRKYLASIPDYLLGRERTDRSSTRTASMVGHDALRLLVRAAAAGAALAACIGVFSVEWSRYPFALEHAVKAPAVMTLMICFAKAFGALTWLCGGRGVDFMGPFPPFAATPAEFWRRWNRPAHEFFDLYVARPLGGMRHPVRAILATFLVSGLGHEYIFSVSSGRLQGYQTAFFLIHGLAVVATLRARPKGWSRLPWWLGTFAFLLVTTVLFGLSVNEIVSIYDSRE